MRVYILYALVAIFSVYAYRNWFRSLCVLILLMAVIEHPDMPKSIMGIQGFNPWNLLLVNVFAGWLISRRREGLTWDMPRAVGILLLLYIFVVLAGVLRLIADPSHLESFSLAQLVSDKLVNSLKWIIPGLLLFDGCRSRTRLALAFTCVLGVYCLLAVQVIRWMPPSAAVSGAGLEARSRKIIQNEIGYSRVNMSMMLSGGSWAILATLPLVRRHRYKILIVAAALGTAYGQALTGGRMGYVTWGAVGLVLGLLRWRRCLLLVPVVVIAIGVMLPGTVERMFEGFGATDATGREYTDDFQITAGRTLIWPYVIDEISHSPIVGHGRMAMVRTGLSEYLWNQYHESFPHPHNAYLEWLLDNGLVGLLCVAPLFIIVLVRAARLFRDTHNPWYAAIGGASLAFTLALLIAAVGSQTFYPREGAVGLWCMIGLTLRLSLARENALALAPRGIALQTPRRVQSLPWTCPAAAPPQR